MNEWLALPVALVFNNILNLNHWFCGSKFAKRNKMNRKPPVEYYTLYFYSVWIFWK